MTANGHFPLTKEGVRILEQSCQAYSYAAERKFACKVVVHNVDHTTASSPGSNKWPTVSKIKYSKQLPGGLKISVWKDDLTAHKVDAVVNAANEQLHHGGGLALALANAGGPEIQKESDFIIRKHARVPTGRAVATTAGKLHCKCIIHAVGPQLARDPSQKEIENASPFLQEAIWSILQITEYDNLQSVAIPAISSGLFNFPRDICADIIVNTVSFFSRKRRTNAQSLEVRLVNNDDPSVKEMLRACTKILGPPDSGAAVQTQSMASAACPSLELGDVTLFLKKGNIEKETVDVIVNTIANNLDLSNGLVTKAILNEAGLKMQKEIHKTQPTFVTDGDVIVTSGFNLRCKEVYHTVCAQKGSYLPASQILHNVVKECLEKVAVKFSSIAFPAIGTGNLGFTKEEVSQIMISAVVEFAKKYKGKKIHVYFVIFPKDADKYKAFEMKMDSIGKTLPKDFSSTGNSSVSHAFEKVSETTPYVELLANSSEALREAKAWSVRMLQMQSTQLTINNNHVTQFGQEDHAQLMSIQTIFNVSITEFFRDGKCGITITGAPTKVNSAALEVEAMLCKAQEDFAQAEENDLLHSVVCWQAFLGSEAPEFNAALEKAYLAGSDEIDLTVNGQKIKIDFKGMQMKTETKRGPISRMGFFSLYINLPVLKSKSYYEVTPIDAKNYSKRDSERKRKFNKFGLDIEKVEKIENNALKQLFELNKKRVAGEPQQLYQCVPAQFCEPISRVGFQRNYAPPKDQQYGAGIYFTTELGAALRLWQDSEEEYIYIIEAQVLTGNYTRGTPQMIVPPFSRDVPHVQYNSVCNDLKDTFVIFNGQQALPEFIITCSYKTGSAKF